MNIITSTIDFDFLMVVDEMIFIYFYFNTITDFFLCIVCQ